MQSKKTSREIYQSVPGIREELTAQPQITRYIGKPEELAARVEKVYHEMTGQNFPDDTKASHAARLLHRHSHALQSASRLLIAPSRQITPTVLRLIAWLTRSSILVERMHLPCVSGNR